MCIRDRSTGSQGAAGSATISNNANNRIITGGSGTNLVGESTLTYDGSLLNVTGNIALPTTNRIYFGNSDTSFIKGEHGSSAYLAFGANNEKMRLTRTGRLGIGQDDPQARLEVRDNSSNNYGTTIRLSQGYNTVFSEISSNFGGSMTLNAGQNTSTALMHFQVNDNEKMRITNGGQVNIGYAIDQAPWDRNTTTNTGVRLANSTTGYAISANSNEIVGIFNRTATGTILECKYNGSVMHALGNNFTSFSGQQHTFRYDNGGCI